ncbi:carboxymuconolactone decarboxylase family protein [Shewanella gelidii]|uniref:Carboxymuconolactone decarboxylase family protein n=1 Tax=Shewanella gelidii TaxID=1642821 RepID=A0A917N6K8_9GAMM|nr:carboxymuconolactone decarboxylase family protein [Shewanella gelidii]MCL1096957.1 carboxymuconolactone decarboxylase family protein [Shewanella gelidii]GGI71492.1 hypothetical protein GCM10009332_06030 [Shewanella gelidii]
MSKFNIHTVETAPAESKAMLQQAKNNNGMIPNLLGVLSESPQTFAAYSQLHQLFTESSLDHEEMTVVWQTINAAHNCTYCVPAHTAIAHSMKVDPELTEALRNGDAMPTEKLQVLRDTTLELVQERGELSSVSLERFYSVGYAQRQLLEIVLGLSQKVISNYVNHLAHTPLDSAFQPFAWEKK